MKWLDGISRSRLVGIKDFCWKGCGFFVLVQVPVSLLSVIVGVYVTFCAFRFFIGLASLRIVNGSWLVRITSCGLWFSVSIVSFCLVCSETSQYFPCLLFSFRYSVIYLSSLPSSARYEWACAPVHEWSIYHTMNVLGLGSNHYS